MKEMDEAVTEAILIWRTIWTPPTNDDISMARTWVAMMGPADVKQFQEAAQIACQKLSYWPKPAEILAIIRDRVHVDPSHKVWKPQQLSEPPITQEQREEILKNMKNPIARETLERLTRDQRN
jgi:hypothetical protein